MADYKEESRKNWGTKANVGVTREQIQLGAILRIADATEAMAKNHVKLQLDYDYMIANRNSWKAEAEALKRSNASLKGVITKLKKKLP
ncbi:hypothetical protein PQ459_10215 [Chryseobacterium sp. KACC 21268]|nr:hypothetical protein PQ459_10215 [Chryseobacterium sp. KACC 21268]